MIGLHGEGATELSFQEILLTIYKQIQRVLSIGVTIKLNLSNSNLGKIKEYTLFLFFFIFFVIYFDSEYRL